MSPYAYLPILHLEKESATIAFDAGKDGTLLGEIMKITKASQISNVAAYMPTDCPTREKVSASRLQLYQLHFMRARILLTS